MNKIGYLPFDRLFLGLIIFSFGWAIGSLAKNDYITALICSVGWYYLFKGFMLYQKTNQLKIQLTGFHKIMYILYMIVTVVMVIRGFTIDYPYPWWTTNGMINMLFFHPMYILPYLIPLVVLIPLKHYRFNVLLSWSNKMVLIGIFVGIAFFPQIYSDSMLTMGGFESEGYGTHDMVISFITPFCFFLFCDKYIKPKQWLILLFGTLACLLIVATAARRGSTLSFLLMLIFAFYSHFHKKKLVVKIIMWTMLIMLTLVLAYYIKDHNMFAFLQQRGFEDSRSGVDIALLRSMDNWQLIFGKGLNGRYYYPLFEEDALKGWRYGSETGFYNIVLKGGFLMAFMHIYLLLIPVLKGLFLSNNQLCKAFGLYILLSLIELYPFGWLMFDVRFFVIWMGVAVCMNRSIRNMTDMDIKQHFFSRT